MEQRGVVGIGKINVTLSSLYVLEPDFVLEVDATDGRRGDPNLTEPSVEQLCPLGQRQVGALL